MKLQDLTNLKGETLWPACFRGGGGDAGNAAGTPL